MASLLKANRRIINQLPSMAAMASLLKPSSSYCTNQTINNRRRIIINPPPPTTRISLPINRRFIFTSTMTQIPLLKFNTAIIPSITQIPLRQITTTTTKCSRRSSSKGSTFREEEKDLLELKPQKQCNNNNTRKSNLFSNSNELETNNSNYVSHTSSSCSKDSIPLLARFGEAMLKVVEGLEKPALTAALVWILLTNNPAIASSSLGRMPIFLGVSLAYDLYKATRIKDGLIRFSSLGPVLGSITIAIFLVPVLSYIMFFLAASMGLLIASLSTILGSIMLFLGASMGIGVFVFGFGVLMALLLIALCL